MQLSLFDDNLATVLLNIAEEYIRSREFLQAVSVYDQILSDTPSDRKVAALREEVDAWLDPLSAIGSGARTPELLQSAWVRLDTIALPSLRETALDMLIEGMRSFPNPEQIFAAPRFHLGQMLMEARRFAEAADCFRSALAASHIPLGTLLAWLGDALTLAEGDAAGLESYLAAFLEEPSAVDIASIKSRTIRDLYLSLSSEAAEEIDGEDDPAWLPVWGWLNGVFPLQSRLVMQESPTGAAAFESLLGEVGSPVPRIWYLMLGYAERLRVGSGDDRESVAVRRLMKKSNGFMFARYLEKIKRSG